MPLVARAQQAMPVVDYMGWGSQASGAHMISPTSLARADEVIE